MSRFRTSAGVLATTVAILLAAGGSHTQSTNSIVLRVAETAGIRRTSYPAGTRLKLAKGALSDITHARLMSGTTEMPAQFTVASSYPDGSVEWLDVDFNVSLAPREEVRLTLEYGPQVTAQATARGLAVAQEATGIQIGSVHLTTSGAPLFTSVKYRQEDIGTGRNGFALVDTSGVSHDATASRQSKVEILKRGPLLVVVQYTGEIPITSTYAVGYRTRVEMPNSKTWVKVTTTLADPERRVRELSFQTPVALGAQPWQWDFGTGSWTYGLLRAPADSVTLAQTVGTSQTTRWEIKTGSGEQQQLYETTAGRRAAIAEGWGHIQDAREVVAFAVPDFGAEAGTYTIRADGAGQLGFRWNPARPLGHLDLAVYLHFVSAPVAVGAVTSPVSMLSPLVVSFVNPR